MSEFERQLGLLSDELDNLRDDVLTLALALGIETDVPSHGALEAETTFGDDDPRASLLPG
jgi:hypothetical protein